MTKKLAAAAKAAKSTAVANVANNEVKVVAKKNGKTLVKRTNVPWRRKYYYLDVAKFEEMSAERKKSANQIQIMLQHMFDKKITDADTSMMGTDICAGAIENGLKTKINPPVLFAYYRADMERLGLVFAGYNLDK